jgi:hypothetical protein
MGTSVEDERWQDNWRVLTPAGAVRVELRGARARGEADRIRELVPGTPVVLSASGPGAARRCRAFATRAGVELEREFLAVPTAKAPGCLVEAAPGPVGTFIDAVLVAPQDSRLGPVADAGLALVRRLGSWRLVRAIVPGRILVGART